MTKILNGKITTSPQHATRKEKSHSFFKFLWPSQFLTPKGKTECTTLLITFENYCIKTVV